MSEITSVVWLILLVVFIAAEAATVQLVSVWFAVGALAAMVVSLLGGELWLQVVVFFILSIAWPVAKKRLKPKVVATNADALVGRLCTVTEEIDPIEGGRVRLGDVTWSARSENGDRISAGARVRVLNIQGAKVFVEEVKKEVEV